jgi:hypothetical protein
MLLMDEVFVAGQTTDNAILLLAEAERRGMDVAVVQAVEGGFLVPESLVGAVYPQATEPVEVPQRRRRAGQLYDKES